jgi:hypothetical protein
LLINSVLIGEATTEPPIRNTTRMVYPSFNAYTKQCSG